VPGYASSITYHPNGQVNQVARTNGVTDTYYEDPYGLPRPRKVVAKRGTTLLYQTGLYGYDGAGDVKKEGSSYYLYDGTYWNGNNYTYDALDQMWDFNNGTKDWLYLYTADGERIWSYDLAANTSHWTIRDLDGKVLRDYKNLGGNWSVDRDYVYRGSTLLAAVTPSGVQHFHLDHLGTVRAITNSAGSRIHYHTYFPFGEEASSPTQDTERMKFAGHERDLANTSSAADDLDYMMARFYNPQIGRFLSTDLRGQRKSLPGGQFWNRYTYSLGSPLKYVDPDSKCAVPAGLKEGQVGICIEAFIAAKRIAMVGLGDNRNFQANDPTGTARLSYKSVIDPASGKILSESEQPGISRIGLTKKLSFGLQGTMDVSGTSAQSSGGTRFSIYLSGKNGFSFLNSKFLGPIGALADFTVDHSGGVTPSDASVSKGYPSVEGYAYKIVQGQLVIQVLFQQREKTTSELNGLVDDPLKEEE
jgi:RHS repeat-associated protein